MKLKSVSNNNIINDLNDVTVDSDNDITPEDTNNRPLSRWEKQTKDRRYGRYTSIDIMSNHTISVASVGFTIPSYFSVDVSTEENYSADDMEFYGTYDCIRKTLDYSYHGM